MANQKYVVAVAPNENFIGPLEPESLEYKWKYIRYFEGGLSDFLDSLGDKKRNDFMRDVVHTSREKFPEIRHMEYTPDLSEARSFSSGAEAHLFAIYMRSFFPDCTTSFEAREFVKVGSERHPLVCY